MAANPPLLSIVGKSKGGKTTLLEKLIPELKRRGYRVATIKHHSHKEFEIDQPGKDTWRYARAGSDVVILSSPGKIASIQKLERELSLDEICELLPEVDIILTEGYKSAGKPSLEVMRAERGLDLISDPRQLLAIVTDTRLENDSFQMDINDVGQIADFVEGWIQSHTLSEIAISRSS
jgi:molybdopterin-guanine dinucleotide biosynthesis protein B